MKKIQPLKNKSKAENKTIKASAKKSVRKPIQHKSGPFNTRTHKQKYGTSKLEADFAHDFLDKLGLKYIYEYEAKDIGRFYDFAVTAYDNIPFIMENKQGINSIKQEGQNVPISFMVEVDGGY